jgi:hypothetical protein
MKLLILKYCNTFINHLQYNYLLCYTEATRLHVSANKCVVLRPLKDTKLKLQLYILFAWLD